MSQPSADEAVAMLKAALLREVVANPAILFPEAKDLAHALTFSTQLSGHINTLYAKAAKLCVCSSLFVPLCLE